MEHIRFDLVDAVLTIAFDRKAKKNALTVGMYSALVDGLTDAAEDDAVKAVVVTGHRDVFTAGNDIRDFVERPPQLDDHAVFRLLLGLVDFPKPLVGAVAGPAIGIGTTMLLHFDQVVAGDNARFSMDFVGLGLVPEGGSSMLIPRLLGHQGAARLLMLGESFGAEEARAMGLVREVVSPDEVHARAHEIAQALARRPAGALREAKQLLKAPYRNALRATIRRESEAFGKRLTTPDALEALNAFLHKG